MAGFVGKIIGAVVGLVVAAVTLPIALSNFDTTDTANWGTAGVAILAIFGLLLAVGVAYYILRSFGLGAGK